MKFKMWLLENDPDTGLRRQQTLTTRDPLGNPIVNTGTQQRDPMYSTLHHKNKKRKKDKIDKLFGFMKKK